MYNFVWTILCCREWYSMWSTSAKQRACIEKECLRLSNQHPDRNGNFFFFFFFLLRIYTIYSTIESWLLHLSSADHIQSPAEIFMSNFDNLENFLIHERVFTKNNWNSCTRNKPGIKEFDKFHTFSDFICISQQLIFVYFWSFHPSLTFKIFL